MPHSKHIFYQHEGKQQTSISNKDNEGVLLLLNRQFIIPQNLMKQYFYAKISQIY